MRESRHLPLKNVLSRDFGAAEIDVFITEFGLDIKEWNDEKESDDGEVVDCDDINFEMVETPDSRPLSGKQAIKKEKKGLDVNKSISGATETGGEDSVWSESYGRGRERNGGG